jgi:hypothetical protein
LLKRAYFIGQLKRTTLIEINSYARSHCCRKLWYASAKQGEKLMPVGMFRSEEGWVQVDYGTGNIPIPRSKYDENRYKPDFDKLPSEAEYWAAEKKKEDDAPRS